VELWHATIGRNQKNLFYRIKRRGHLLETQPRRPGVYSNPAGPGVYLLSAFFSHPFLSSLLEVYWIKNQTSTKTFKKCETWHHLCLISVNLVSHLSKNITDRNSYWTLLLHFSVIHGGTEAATARQQTYCARNLEQGCREVPSPSVLRKAKLLDNSRNCREMLGNLPWLTRPQKTMI